jgi:hypothetical protein
VGWDWTCVGVDVVGDEACVGCNTGETGEGEKG